MPPVQGILETALYVSDLRRSATFYRRVFGFEALLESDRLIALDVAGKNVLLLFKAGATVADYATPGGVIPGHGGPGQSHFAFAIDTAAFDAWRQSLEAHGIAIESTVTWPHGARSLYIRDPDEHLVELITQGFWKIY